MYPIHRHSPPIALIEENSTGGKLPIYPGFLFSRTTAIQNHMATHYCNLKELSNGRGWFRVLFDEEKRNLGAEICELILRASLELALG